ncbi:hypothetical protein DESC_740221 [Desulfosarcina cetonica]|nr:hypothetical protein DESC_740221 [Desulfosarcina cetonica]
MAVSGSWICSPGSNCLEYVEESMQSKVARQPYGGPVGIAVVHGLSASAGSSPDRKDHGHHLSYHCGGRPVDVDRCASGEDRRTSESHQPQHVHLRSRQ